MNPNGVNGDVLPGLRVDYAVTRTVCKSDDMLGGGSFGHVPGCSSTS